MTIMSTITHKNHGSAIAMAAVVACSSSCFLFDGAPEQRVDPTVQAKQTEGAAIVDKLGAQVPMDGMFTNEQGQVVSLRSVIPATKPTVLVIGYYECPMLCSLVLNGLKDGLQGVDFLPGQDFQVVSISLDPQEKPSLALAKQQNYIRDYNQATGRNIPVDGWRFLLPPADGGELGSNESKTLKAIADAVGFGYKFDPATGDYAHSAGVFFLSPDGVLTRTLFGVQFEPQDVRLALVEAGKGVIGTITDRLLLTCFQFQPHGRYTIYAWGIMRIAGLVIIAAMGTFLFVMFRQERRRASVTTPAE
jgi:protein SCO1